jgi:TPR repeat protein
VEAEAGTIETAVRHYAKLFRAALTASVMLAAIAGAAIADPPAIEGYKAYKRGDYTEAAKRLREGAEQGDAEAQHGLAGLYLFGNGVPQDYAEAAKWFRKAAEQGHVGAQFQLGTLYGNGQGVARDAVEAAKWFRKAAEQGDADSQLYLGSMSFRGNGVPKDEVEAVKWWRRAAEQGLAGAQFILGGLYGAGKVLPEDDVEAYKWLNLAASRFRPFEREDRDKAIALRDELTGIMTPDQIAEAQKLSREWKPKPER